MSFQTLARRVRDPKLPLGLRYAALRSAVEHYRQVGYHATWAFITGAEAPVGLDEADLLSALERIETSRTARLAETAAFAERRTALKRLRIPADREEVRYRFGRRWPGPDAREATTVAVAYQWRSRDPSSAAVEAIEAEFAPIVEAYLDGGLDTAARRRLPELSEQVETAALALRAEHGIQTSVLPLLRTAELIRNDVLPLVRRGWIGDAARVTEVFWAARSRMTYLPALHTYDETAWWVREVMMPSSELWVAEQRGVPVGFAALEGNSLSHLYVEPAAQGLGVGEALLTKAKRRRKGLDLLVFEQNLGARAFYERHGFSLFGRGSGSGNEEGLPDLHLLWRR